MMTPKPNEQKKNESIRQKPGHLSDHLINQNPENLELFVEELARAIVYIAKSLGR
jgi:hypothetical protein